MKPYYHQMEVGTIDPAGVSGRCCKPSAGSLVSASEIEEAGDFTGFAAAVPAAPTSAPPTRNRRLSCAGARELPRVGALLPPRPTGRGRPALPRRPMTSALERRLAAEAAAERELARCRTGSGTARAPRAGGDDRGQPLRTVRAGGAPPAEYAGLPDGIHISGCSFPRRGRSGSTPARPSGRRVSRRFTIGHEVGHWVLHCDPGSAGEEPVYCRTESCVRSRPSSRPGIGGFRPLSDDRAGRQPVRRRGADAAGARRKGARLGDGVPWKLAQAFGVSVEAIEWRMRFLAGR